MEAAARSSFVRNIISNVARRDPGLFDGSRSAMLHRRNTGPAELTVHHWHSAAGGRVSRLPPPPPSFVRLLLHRYSLYISVASTTKIL